ncbi:MAG: LacI family DNA-binding transcriptional regulator [Verrucomicrobiota bacterium]
MSTKRRITLRDIAKKGGVSATTVSLALRDHPSIPDNTRRRLKALAEKMGYRPDPLLSALSNLKTGKHRGDHHSLLVFVSDMPKDHWTNKPGGPIYTEFSATANRGKELGYAVEYFCLQEFSQKRLNSILEARGVRGLIVGALQHEHRHLKFDWDRLVAVTLTHGLAHPSIPFVTHNNFKAVSTAWNKLRHLGYLRIGLLLSRFASSQAGHEWQAAQLLMQQHPAVQDHIVPSLIQPEFTTREILNWIEDYQIEVILTIDGQVREKLKEGRYKIPKDIGFVHLDVLPIHNPDYSGIYQNRDLIGSSAVDLIHLMLQRGEVASNCNRRGITIEGSWHEGKTTLKPRSDR